MQWDTLLNASRLGGKPAKIPLGRSPFLSDYDKIVFSQAFRRLARKTQVHPLASNDHVHNRLTHSLEVSCVGRSLALLTGKCLLEAGELSEGFSPQDLGDIVQSACLAHDLGNPPFGHTGEEAIRKWFRKNPGYLSGFSAREKNDFLFYEGNAQGFRILSASGAGKESSILNMTYATLGAFLKYPFASDTAFAIEKKKFGIFSSEQEQFVEVAKNTGLCQLDEGYARHPLVYLVEAADDFCYGLLDLEDGLQMGLVPVDDLYDVFSPLLSSDQKADYEKKIQVARKERAANVLRGLTMDVYIQKGAEAFFDHRQKILAGALEGDLISACGSDIQRVATQAKELAREVIFIHPRKVELEIGAYEIIYNILDKLIPAVTDWHENDRLNEKEHDMIIRLLGEDNLPATRSYYQVLMAAMDFVSGMTDNYASYLSRQMMGNG